MKLYTFYQLFRFNSNKEVEAIRKVKIGLLTFHPGAKIERGTVIAGINVFDYIGDHWDCQILKDGTYKVRKIYLHDGHHIYSA
jgi:hypothetical protein